MNSSLRSAPYEYEFDHLVVVIIRAHNVFGWSEWSPPNLAGAFV